MKKFKNDFMLLINEVLKIFRIEFGGEENIIPISLLSQENIIDVLEKKLDQDILFYFNLLKKQATVQ